MILFTPPSYTNYISAQTLSKAIKNFKENKPLKKFSISENQSEKLKAEVEKKCLNGETVTKVILRDLAHEIVGRQNPAPSLAWCRTYLKKNPMIRQVVQRSQAPIEEVDVEVCDFVAVAKEEISNLELLFEAIVEGRSEVEDINEMRKKLKEKNNILLWNL